MQITTNSEQETLNFAQKYAQGLKPGQIIGLIGPLGAGKTAFTKGLAYGLGIKQNVSSPTFNLMRLYEVRTASADPGIKKFCHIDAYRVQTEYEIIDIGAEDFIGKDDTLTVVEWADRIRDILPRRTIYIKFEAIDENRRNIDISEPAKE